MGTGGIEPVILVLIVIANLILLVWFVVSINRIKGYLAQIVTYTRRTALSLPLTSGQAKLINQSFTPGELLSIIEKQGGKPLFEQKYDLNMPYEALVIGNRTALDPELVALALSHEKEIIALLQARKNPS